MSQTGSANSTLASPARRGGLRPLARRWPKTLYVTRRLGASLLLLWLVSLLIILGLELLPGDAAQAMLGKAATETNLAALRAELGLDQPMWSRYAAWIGNLLQGDLGTSFSNRRPVADTVLPRLSLSLLLACCAALVTLPLAITAGAWAARHNGSRFDRALRLIARCTISAPEFFTGYAVIFIFALWLGWLPSSVPLRPGMALSAQLQAMILPVLVLFLAVAGHVVITTRSALLDILSQPWIEMARLKGLSEARILWQHALPNAIGPIANVALLNLAYMITGVMVVETIFALPGLGQYLVDSVAKRDMPVVQACSLIFAAVYILLNLGADLAATLGTPRIRSRL